jgi:WD40 repeat protein
VRIWEGNRVVFSFVAPTTVTSLAISSDGRILATGSDDGTTRFWDIATGQQIGVSLTGATAPITGVAFTPNRKLAVAGSLDGTIRLWDVATQQEVGAPVTLGGQSGLTDLAISPDGKVLATGDQQGDVDLFDIATDRLVGTDQAILASILKLTFSPDGTSLTAVTATGQAVTWSVAPFRRSGDPLLITTSKISAVAGNGNLLAVGDVRGHIVLWSYGSRWQLGTAVPLYKGAVTSEIYAPDGSRLISGSADGRVIVWNMVLSAWKRAACDIAARNLSAAEWQQFIGGKLPHTPLCPAAIS